ncbi:MAG: phosphoribosyltransferase family protein [Parasphingorhabdus sp.]|uniref:phosphoribosyltransferase n=1 Tax=Parasphingorhabdus sp. TaxID=2709688 RepID=UPI0030034082
MTIEKSYITADALLSDSFRLGMQILRSDFCPTHIVGIWRGGAPVGIAVQEILEFHDVKTDHIAIRTSSYSGIDKQERSVRVYALGYLVDTLNPDDSLLIVDDVFDSGRSIEAFLTELGARCRHNMPKDVRVATIYSKPSRNQTDLKPDFFIHETEDWLIFPHELNGLTKEEICQNKSDAAIIFNDEVAPTPIEKKSDT